MLVKYPWTCGLVAKMVAQIGWTWCDFYHFSRPGRSDLPLSTGPESWWSHELRDALRLSRWPAAASSRQIMEGLDAVAGIDPRATVSLLCSKIDPYDAGVLRGILPRHFCVGLSVYKNGCVKLAWLIVLLALSVGLPMRPFSSVSGILE